ncbi:hypothetical protein RSOL_387020, partial [Rhizoctonia solani AG-3 Rhs1AP]
MLSPVSALCSGSDYSSMLSNTRDATSKCLLRFSKQFLHYTDDISKWHRQQPSRRFRTIQYRKERTGVGHEFILLLLQRDPGGDVDCYCRVERVGDAEHLAQVVCIDGTIAEDYIHAIPLSDARSANLTDNSDAVAEITLPQTFMLRNVLAICYVISNHYRAKRYTLQQYNCYFFSWTVILALGRACMNWDTSASIPEHVSNIHDRIMESIYDQGPARFHSVVYIVSNNTLASHENEEHPLDQAISAWLCSSGLADSIATALKGVLWADRLHFRLIEAISGELQELASKSVNLTTCNEAQSEGMDSPVIQDNRDLDFEYALGRLTQKAALVLFENFFRALLQMFPSLSSTCILLKQRLGHEVWCKELAHCLRHTGLLFFQGLHKKKTLACESAEPHGHRPTSSSIRDLCFIPPAVLLGFSARFMVTCGLTMCMCIRGVALSLKSYGAPKKNIFKRGKTIVWSAAREVGTIPRSYAASKHMVLYCVGTEAASRLDPMACGLLDNPDAGELGEVAMKGARHISKKRQTKPNLIQRKGLDSRGLK